MAHRRKTKVVDGYSTLRAAQKAAAEGRTSSTPKKSADSEAAPPSPDAPQPIAARIGHTVLPSRREIICPECGAPEEVVGKTSQTVCPKCRARLKLEDHVLDEGWSEGELHTAGDVRLPAGAEITGGDIRANNIRIEGVHRGGTLRASRCLTWGKEAEIVLNDTEALDLEIEEGVILDCSDHKLKYRNVQLHGHLKARLECERLLHLHPSGCFDGSVRAPQLQVDEGAGLRAELKIQPPPPGQRKKTPGRVPVKGNPGNSKS